MVQINRASVTRFDPSTGEARVQCESTGGAVVFALPSDDKYLFDIEVVTAAASAPEFVNFQVSAGDSSMGAWQAQDITVSAPCTSTGTWYYAVGPFESAKVAHGATSTSGGRTVRGQRAIKIDFRGSTGVAGWPETSEASTGDQANILMYELPEIEYTT